MATTTKTRIWLGIGSFALVQAAEPLLEQGSWALATPASAQAGHAHGEGGEGGEAGAAAAEGPLSDAGYATALHLMLGHLAVGEELVALDAWNDALPHFAHPAEEIYAGVAPELSRRDAVPFADDLELLARRVKARDKGDAYGQGLAEVRARIEAALAGIDPGTRAGAPFAAEVMAGLLRTAADEYGAAFEDGKLVAVVEYQDSRGFVGEARRLLGTSRAALEKADAARTGRMAADLEAVAKAWPAALPPASPVLEPGEVSALVSRLELDAGGFR